MREASKKRDEFCMMWEQTDEANEGWSTPAKKAVEELRGFLTQAGDISVQVMKDYKVQLAVDMGCSDALKAQVADLKAQG